MNAGTADGNIGDFVSAVYYLHPDGTIGEFKPGNGLPYTAFHAPAGSVLVGCRLQFHRRPLAEIQKDIKQRLKTKKSTQPLALASAGCVWKNPPGELATRLIEKAAVEVRGASRVPPERILEASGIVHGESLWRIDPHQVQLRLEELPEIRRADVVRELPNRVSIVVEERRPFTLVHAGRLHWLDEEGRVLGEEGRAVVPEVPVISGLSEDELVSMRTTPGPRARAAITLIRALLRTGSALASEISEIDMSRS